MPRGKRKAKRRPELLTLGAQALLKFLEDHAILRSEFAAQAGVSRLQLYRVLTGQTVQVSLDFALAVARATDGVIEAEDFAFSTRSRTTVLDVPNRPAAKRIAMHGRA